MPVGVIHRLQIYKKKRSGAETEQSGDEAKRSEN